LVSPEIQNQGRHFLQFGPVVIGCKSWFQSCLGCRVKGLQSAILLIHSISWTESVDGKLTPFVLHRRLRINAQLFLASVRHIYPKLALLLTVLVKQYLLLVDHFLDILQRMRQRLYIVIDLVDRRYALDPLGLHHRSGEVLRLLLSED